MMGDRGGGNSVEILRLSSCYFSIVPMKSFGNCIYRLNSTLGILFALRDSMRTKNKEAFDTLTLKNTNLNSCEG